MKKLLPLLLCACLLCAPFLSGCTPAANEKPSSITVFNWEDYINPEIFDLFEKETGIKVTYTRFTTNEEMYLRLDRGGVNYDVAFPSDYMIERLVKNDLLLPLDHEKLPEFKNTYAWLQTPDYDPESKYSVPYMWGTVGILYNTEMTDGEIDSWGAMWDAKYLRNVLMMDSVRDSLGITLCYLGFDLNTRDETQLAAAAEMLKEQKRSGVVLAYGVDEIKDKMVNNEAALGLVWSGDAITSIDLNEGLAFCVPKEGSNVWIDGMVIPRSSKNPEGALAFINFMMRPEIAAMNSEYIGYSTPNEAAMAILGAEYSENPIFNPPAEVIARCKFFHDVEDALETYNRIWEEVMNE
ncbi:MAG: spermidine/putrescine ABC transporter substrate-binding protein [Christensenellaceae bacterium]|jgi:spermidine/putrescine-binding protein|nr:spermidine/putrescine ABC transporter substrate-binding protein [Christensenellaceae bacterium]